METNTQLTTVNSLNDVMTMAKAFANSGMFLDTKQEAQAFVKIQAGIEIGITPFMAMSGIHIIQGKVTIGAGIIAAKVKGSGKYDYKVVEATETKCSIDFYQGKEKLGNSTFTIDDARKAQTKNIDKFPKNMLFARAISNGVKFYAPDVFSGSVYVPEEMEVITEDAPHEVIPESQKQLPNITPVQFLKAKTRVSAGEDILETLKNTFILSQEQIDSLVEAYESSLKFNEENPETPIEKKLKKVTENVMSKMVFQAKKGENVLNKYKDEFIFTDEQTLQLSKILQNVEIQNTAE